MKLKEDGVVPIHGINHRDRPQDAAKWLDDLGDPYTRTGADLNGRVSIEWGVYGVPETFVIDREGRIVFKQVGPVTPEVYRDKIRSEEHTSELQSLMRNSYAVFCLKKK